MHLPVNRNDNVCVHSRGTDVSEIRNITKKHELAGIKAFVNSQHSRANVSRVIESKACIPPAPQIGLTS